jgi:hypothetical protein
LPNVSGAAIQNANLAVGDLCYVTGALLTFVCTLATAGSATWGALERSGTVAENGAAINWTTQNAIANIHTGALATFTLPTAADLTTWPIDVSRVLTKTNTSVFGMGLAVGVTQTVNGGAVGVGITSLPGSTLVPSPTTPQTAPSYLIWRQSATAFWVS